MPDFTLFGYLLIILETNGSMGQPREAKDEDLVSLELVYGIFLPTYILAVFLSLFMTTGQTEISQSAEKRL